MFDTPIADCYGLLQAIRLHGTPKLIVLKPRLRLVTVRMNTGTIFEWSLEGFKWPEGGPAKAQAIFKIAFKHQKTSVEVAEDTPDTPLKPSAGTLAKGG